MTPLRSRSAAGFSLVVSLIILTLLAVLVVSFLSSTALDRTTAHAFLGKSQAELAADTAVNQAISLLREHITEYPDSVTFWEMLQPAGGSKSLPVEGTMLYFNDQPLPDGSPVNVSSLDVSTYKTTSTTATTSQISTRSKPTTRYILPLISRGVDDNGRLLGAVPLVKKTEAMGTEPLSETPFINDHGELVETCVDVNRARYNGDNVGWIGSPAPESGTVPKAPRPFRARWIELKEKTTTETPRTIGRYAFWMEDESFKLNLNQMGSLSTSRGNEWTESSRLKATPAETATDPLPLQFASLLPVQGVLRSARAPTTLNRDTVASDVTVLREAFLGKSVPDLRTFNQVATNAVSPVTGDAYRLADELKYLATTSSSSLNLSRHGSQRLNLNGIGFEKRWDDPSVSDAEIKKGLDQLVATVRYHAPKFSQRFYRLLNSTSALVLNDENTVPADTAQKPYRAIYLYKMAANIRDYIDPDSQPTLIRGENGKALIDPQDRQQQKLALPDGDGTNPIWAQGKDSAPFLQEAVVRYRTKLTGTTWELWVDYYIEFWNMTDRDITAEDLGPNPYLAITSQLGWVTTNLGEKALIASETAPGAVGNPAGSDFSPATADPLRATVVSIKDNVFVNGAAAPKGVVFKAGQCTVITTDPDYLGGRTTGSTPAFSGSYNTANVYYCKTHFNEKGFASHNPNAWPRSNRYYKGTFTDTLNGATGLKPRFRDGSEDYQTEVVLGNDKGFLEFHASPFAHGGGAKETNSSTKDRDDWYGGTLFGNSSNSTATVSQLGDPRTNNEQLNYRRFISGSSTAEPDQSRYWNTTSDPRFTIGYPNTKGGSTLYVNPHLASTTWPLGSYPTSAPFPWPDYYKGWIDGNITSNLGRDTAPARAFDGRISDPLTGNIVSPAATTGNVVNGLYSIGQLGDVFDPARLKGGKGNAGIEGSRGGGRTYRIGQHDDRTDLTAPNAPSQGWASWRLADFLSISNEIQLPGTININGLMRDAVRDADGNPVLDANGRYLGAGAALRAACYGMKLLSTSRPNSGSAAATTAEKNLDSEEPAKSSALAASLQNAIDQAIKRMTVNDPGSSTGGFDPKKPYFGPFSERGEISELDAWSLGSSLTPGVKMEESFDHSREEIVRRLIEHLTTRGNVFSVYAVGQSINEGPPPKRQRIVTGTHRTKVTFRLLPKREDGSDFRVTAETFDPTNSTEVQARFAKPHHYDVELLQVSSL